MTVTNRMNLPPLEAPATHCLDCGRPLSADFMHGLLVHQGFCEDCLGRHVYQASREEPGFCAEPGCGEPHHHRDHIRAAQIPGRSRRAQGRTI